MGGRLAVIVVAGGSGVRFGSSEGKQLTPVLGRPLLAWTVEALAAPPTEHLVLVCHPDRVDEYRDAVTSSVHVACSLEAVAGGETRQASVARGLAAVADGFEFVAVHDGARPLVDVSVLSVALEQIARSGADGAVLGHPCFDTLKQVAGRRVVATADRSEYWLAQTPQVFRTAALVEAFESAASSGFLGTDDASVMEHAKGTVDMVQGSRENIKVTTAEDVRFVEAVLNARREAAAG